MNVGTMKDIMRCDVLLVSFWACYRGERCPRLVLATMWFKFGLLHGSFAPRHSAAW